VEETTVIGKFRSSPSPNESRTFGTPQPATLLGSIRPRLSVLSVQSTSRSLRSHALQSLNLFIVLTFRA
jgi:hypothetical protein